MREHTNANRVMNVQVVKHADELKPLAEGWNALVKQFRSPLLTYEWFESCARATCPPAELFVVVLRDKGAIRGIAPMAMCKNRGVTALEFLGLPLSNLHEPCDFLYEDEQALDSLLEALASLRVDRTLSLDRIPVESPTATLLARRKEGMFVLPWRKKTQSLFVTVSGSWQAFEARMAKSRRNDLKRGMKIAAKSGDVTFQTVKPTPETYLDFLREFFIVEASGWKGRNGTAVSQSPYQRRFWVLYCETLSRQGRLTVFTMRIDGRPVAMRLAADYCGRLWELKIGYDERFRRCSPGILLTHETIRYAFDQGLEGYEFLGEEEPWEHTWSDDVREYLSFRLFPASMSGMYAFGNFAARYATSHGSRYIHRLYKRAERAAAR